MEWLINTIKEIWSWFTSLEGVGTVTLGSIVTFVVQLVLKNKTILKANAKYNGLSEEYKQYRELAGSEKDFYKKQLAQYHVIIDDIYDLAIQLTDNAKYQNEAMTTAFNNSNLNASAKKLVEELLKPIQSLPREDEMYKYPQNEISNAVREVTPEEEVKENEQPKVFRVK
jgi:hypothetical protein